MKTNKKAGEKTFWSVLYNNLMGGLRPMIPFVAGGGILMALSFMMGMGTNAENAGYLAKALYEIGHNGAMVLLIPVFAGYISYTMAGQDGLAAGMIGGMVAKNTGSGFLGGIIAGFMAGIVAGYLKKILKNFPENFESIKKLFIIPVLSTLVVGLLKWV